MTCDEKIVKHPETFSYQLCAHYRTNAIAADQHIAASRGTIGEARHTLRVLLEVDAAFAERHTILRQILMRDRENSVSDGEELGDGRVPIGNSLTF